MKRSRLYSADHRARKVACTVSAAALMLGVAQSATVGFNFQCDWDDAGAHAYTGKAVTATAFNVPTNSWENLTPVPTGYGPAKGPFVGFTEVIDTTTSSGGLNPLPKGSITVTWSATAGNCSGWAGYGIGYGAPNPNPGSEQVYYGFLRDETNIYSSPVPGPIPYNVTITGLRSVWTNYAIEVVNATDSGTLGFTNTVISGTGGTEDLTYNVPLGGAVVGGLSTASGLRTEDSLNIYGRPASKTGGMLASTIAGFIITDVPVITMSPNQKLVCAGDTVTWSGYAVGVPPLSYQWRKNGVPIPGATTPSYSITNVGTANAGTYDLVVTNVYGSAVSSPVSPDGISTKRINNLVLDSNPNGPEHDGLNYGASWLASSTDSGSVTRTGVMNFTASVPSQITVAGGPSFDATNGTIMFWMRSSGVANTATNSPATLFDRLISGKGCVIVQNADGTLTFQAGAGASTATTTTPLLSDNRWHQVAVVYGQDPSSPPPVGGTGFYIDGVANTIDYSASPWSWPTGQELELGLSHDAKNYQAYNGLMDDVRFYNRALTDAEIVQAHNGALVDNNALVMQLTFTKAPEAGITLTWGLPSAILQSADSVNGTYTDVPNGVSPYTVSIQKSAKFYRYSGVRTPQVVVSNPYLM